MSHLFIDATFKNDKCFNRAARFKQKTTDIWEAQLELPSTQGLANFILRKENLAPLGLRAYNQWSLSVKIVGHTGAMVWPFRWLRLCGFKLHSNVESALANGYQCWSESPMLGKNQALPTESFPEREVFGDAGLYHYSKVAGQFHSWSFTYTTLEGLASNAFYGALDEDLFSTVFEINLTEQLFDIALECEGADFASIRSRRDTDHDGTLLGAWMLPEPECAFLPSLSNAQNLWMRLIRQFERTPRHQTQDEFIAELKPVTGYTSWYHRYNAINEENLSSDLAGIDSSTGYGIFQVDDGYQATVGDWLKSASGFPNGLKSLFDVAKSKGLERGIWCAPFIALEHSNIVKLHPEWVLKNSSGQAVVCGNHPLWGGLFFALDTENLEFQAHLRRVLQTYFKEWGCSFLKADFLYASARISAGGLTRAQRAVRAHQFLYDECRKYGAKLLSCGATLSSAYGRCHYSRIGPDVCETWENAEMGTTASREKVSTRATLVNTITRAGLDGICFGNDPDVVILRDVKQQMSRADRHLLATLNAHLGRLIFCSDPLQAHTDWQRNEWNEIRENMATRAGFNIAAICGRTEPSGHMHYQIVLKGKSNNEGMQLRVNLNDIPLAGATPRSHLSQIIDKTDGNRNDK
jgi:alpha-galactosidase